mmetsp:Transcript_26224/g.66687  ORF Transcript_26224/g.66687 Transcript_26224/m.66687 type:complete len:114 (-) Transcript_26224:3469-3810(-)
MTCPHHLPHFGMLLNWRGSGKERKAGQRTFSLSCLAPFLPTSNVGASKQSCCSSSRLSCGKRQASASWIRADKQCVQMLYLFDLNNKDVNQNCTPPLSHTSTCLLASSYLMII